MILSSYSPIKALHTALIAYCHGLIQLWMHRAVAVYSLWRCIAKMAYIVMACAVINEIANCVRMTAAATALRGAKTQVYSYGPI